MLCIKFAALIVTAFVILFIAIDDSFIDLNIFEYNVNNKESLKNTTKVQNPTQPPLNHSEPQEKDRSNLLFDHCILPKLDPWDPTVINYFHERFDPLRNCKPVPGMLTNIINNSIILDAKSEDYTCTYRCLLPSGDNAKTEQNWERLENGTKPQCDIVQVQCYNATSDKVVYKFMHPLIHRDNNKLPDPESLEMSSTYIIVLDSVSAAHFERTMPRTGEFLRNVLEAQPMLYLNKVDLNSRPNAYAFLMGKPVRNIEKSPYSVGYKKDPKYECHKPVDDDQFIIYRYRDAGYVTYMAEDFVKAVFNWPDCTGFRKTPVHHFMRPFQLASTGDSAEANEYQKILFQNRCKEEMHYLLNYFQQFMDTYDDRPKFAINWFTNLGHNNPDGLFHADKYFHRFLQKNEKYFQDSNLIIMADHGSRFGKARETPQGQTEDNNPMLWISIPRNKRTPDQMEQLRVNSKKLISHYDIYATLYHLVNPSNTTHPDAVLYGENLLGPLKEPRTCDRLRIPFEYCICERSAEKLPQNDPLAVQAANMCIDVMNAQLASNNATGSKCATLYLNEQKGVAANRFIEKGNSTLYEINWVTTPGNGAFSAYVLEESNGQLKIISKKFPRNNAYASQAECVARKPRESYCFCKNLLQNESK